jgi:hypothetical protein
VWKETGWSLVGIDGVVICTQKMYLSFKQCLDGELSERRATLEPQYSADVQEFIKSHNVLTARKLSKQNSSLSEASSELLLVMLTSSSECNEGVKKLCRVVSCSRISRF